MICIFRFCKFMIAGTLFRGVCFHSTPVTGYAIYVCFLIKASQQPSKIKLLCFYS